MTTAEIKTKLEEIEARPLSRAERDRLQVPLLDALRGLRDLERVRRFGFTATR